MQPERARRATRPPAPTRLAIAPPFCASLGAMRFNRALGSAKHMRDLLIEQTADYERKDLACSRSVSLSKRAHHSRFRRRVCRSAAPQVSARCTTSSSSCPRTGLLRKSTAPCFIARTAEEMSPWAVRKITGKGSSDRASASCNSRPLGRYLQVEHHAAGSNQITPTNKNPNILINYALHPRRGGLTKNRPLKQCL